MLRDQKKNIASSYREQTTGMDTPTTHPAFVRLFIFSVSVSRGSRNSKKKFTFVLSGRSLPLSVQVKAEQEPLQKEHHPSSFPLSLSLFPLFFQSTQSNQLSSKDSSADPLPSFCNSCRPNFAADLIYLEQICGRILFLRSCKHAFSSHLASPCVCRFWSDP